MSDYPKVLIQYGKHGNTVILCLNEQREQEAWLALFHAMDQWTGYYDRFITEDQLEFRDKARQGCWHNAKWLLEARDMNEYEGFEIQSISGPRKLFKQLGVVEKDGRWVRA